MIGGEPDAFGINRLCVRSALLQIRACVSVFTSYHDTPSLNFDSIRFCFTPRDHDRTLLYNM